MELPIYNTYCKKLCNTYYKKRLAKRFMELHKKIQDLEDDGCFKRSCSTCHLLTRFDEYLSTCPRVQYGEEMQHIFDELFPEDKSWKTWRQKVEQVNNLLQGENEKG